MEEHLTRLIEAARSRTMSETDREEQRINFAYGNAAEGDKSSTKDSVRTAAAQIKQTANG